MNYKKESEELIKEHKKSVKQNINCEIKCLRAYLEGAMSNLVFFIGVAVGAGITTILWEFWK